MGSIANNIHLFSDVETASGAWSGNTPRLVRELVEVCVRPATAGTTYDFNIVDEDDFTVFNRPGREGEYVATLCLPCRGIYTLNIENASADEAFTVKLLHE